MHSMENSHYARPLMRTYSPMSIAYSDFPMHYTPSRHEEQQHLIFQERFPGNVAPYHYEQDMSDSNYVEESTCDVPKRNPFSPLCMIPLPGCLEFEPGLGPAFVRRRNERERERVRCVNEGYARLKEHLPVDSCDKRISKVEILRAAIRHIHHLENLLSTSKASENSKTVSSKRKFVTGRKTTVGKSVC